MELRITAFQKYERMSVVQFLTGDQNSVDYISGPEAMEMDLVKVKEINQSGSVNDLYVFNLSTKNVFFMDGDIIIGAKQNRVLNTSVLLAPNSKVTLPVSCVEQGRWDLNFSDFKPSEFIAPQKLRANKAQTVKENREIRKTSMANQSMVWNDVADYAAIYKCKSPTGSLNDVYLDTGKDAENYIDSFKSQENSNGIGIFRDETLISADIFNRVDIFRQYFRKIIRSSAMEMLALKKKENKLSEIEAVFKLNSLFDCIELMESTSHPGIGVGEEKRFENEEITGLSLEFGKHIIHLTALNHQHNKGNKGNNVRRNRIL
jgi:hypothetical protein